MSYIITKRTECERCLGGRRKGMEHGCDACGGTRVVEYPVDFDEVLLSRLAKLRWNPRFTDNGTEWDEFDGMEIKDE